MACNLAAIVDRSPRIAGTRADDGREPIVVSGRVSDASGEPLAGAELRVRTLPEAVALKPRDLVFSASDVSDATGTRTDADGRFQLALQDLPDGDATRCVVVLRASGMQPVWCVGTAHELRYTELRMVPGNRVVGRVVARDGGGTGFRVYDIDTGESVWVASGARFALSQSLGSEVVLSIRPRLAGVDAHRLHPPSQWVRRFTMVDTRGDLDVGELEYPTSEPVTVAAMRDGEFDDHADLIPYVNGIRGWISRWRTIQISDVDPGQIEVLATTSAPSWSSGRCGSVRLSETSTGIVPIELRPYALLFVRFVDSVTSAPLPVRRAELAVSDDRRGDRVLGRFHEGVGRWRLDWCVQCNRLGRRRITVSSGGLILGTFDVTLEAGKDQVLDVRIDRSIHERTDR